jgi:hypothetical protein
VLADPLDQQRHLVRHQADVGCHSGEDSEARAVTRGRDEQEAVVHLDHGLAYSPGAEVASGALGQAVEAGGDGREVFGVLAPQRGGRAHRESVVRQHHRVPHLGHAQHQVVQQPVEFAGLRGGPHVRILDHAGSPSLLSLPASRSGVARRPGDRPPPRAQPSR